MRHLKWLALLAFLILPKGLPGAQGAPIVGLAPGSGPSPGVIEVVNCGRGAHYVRGHRWHGHWVKGRCVWNHRRR
jgi:hypothetical protein